MSNKMLVGSMALKHYFPDMKRKCDDIDYFITNDLEKFNICENSEYRTEFYIVPKNVIDYPLDGIIKLNDLYTLKISHAIRDIFFRKHLSDIQFLQIKGCEINYPLLERLRKFWDGIHGIRKIPDFDKTNEEFFNDNVKREWNHDEIHLKFMYESKPQFTEVKFDQSKASIEISLFNKLTFEKKLRIVLEETFVIAYERYLAKPDNIISKKYAFNLALKSLITRLFPEEIAIFALINYITIDRRFKDFKEFLKIIDEN